MLYLFFFVIVCVFLFLKFHRKHAPAVCVDSRQRYLAQFVPQHLESSDYFTPSFLERLSVCLLETGNLPKLKPDDLCEGVNFGNAYATLMWCTSIASARFVNLETINKASAVEARYINLKVTRPDVKCPRIPKERKYKTGEPVPLYPCEDCGIPACLVWYKLIF